MRSSSGTHRPCSHYITVAMHVSMTPKISLNYILHGWRLPRGQDKRDSSRSNDLEAPKEEGLALPATTRDGCSSNSRVEHGKLSDSSGTKDKETGQSSSMFFSRLPFEVRAMIYEELFCKPVGVVHITVRKDGKLVHFRCKAENGLCRGLDCFHDLDEDLYSAWRTRDKDLFSTWNPCSRPNTADGGSLAFLQSCRQVSVYLHTCNIVQIYYILTVI